MEEGAKRDREEQRKIERRAALQSKADKKYRAKKRAEREKETGEDRKREAEEQLLSDMWCSPVLAVAATMKRIVSLLFKYSGSLELNVVYENLDYEDDVFGTESVFGDIEGFRTFLEHHRSSVRLEGNLVISVLWEVQQAMALGRVLFEDMKLQREREVR